MLKYVFSFQQLVSEYINGSIHILNKSLILSVQDKKLKNAWSGKRLAVDYLMIYGALSMPIFYIKRWKNLMTSEKNIFFLILVITQKVVNYIILALRKLLLVVMLFFMKLNFRHGVMMMLNKIFQYI